MNGKSVANHIVEEALALESEMGWLLGTGTSHHDTYSAKTV